MMETATFLQKLQVACNDTGIRINTLGHLQRGAHPTCRDRWIALNYGRNAMEAVIKGQCGTAVSLIDDEFLLVEI